MKEVGEKGIPGAVMIPSGFAEVGENELQDELLAAAREHNVRIMGPNIYGFYYTPANLCATFCTPYDVKGKAALSSQSGVGMSIIGFSRSTKMGVSAIVGLGNKSDLDEDDLLTYFEQDDNTDVIAMHAEDLKDGRSFAANLWAFGHRSRTFRNRTCRNFLLCTLRLRSPLLAASLLLFSFRLLFFDLDLDPEGLAFGLKHFREGVFRFFFGLFFSGGDRVGCLAE